MKTINSIGFFICLLGAILVFGCGENATNPAGTQDITNSVGETAVVPKISFKFVFPDNLETGHISPSIYALGSPTPQVTFRLIAIDPGNSLASTTTKEKTVDVTTSGVAEASFEGIPVRSLLGQVHIANGNKGGYSDFRGALDPIANIENVMELAPKGSKLKPDFIAYVFEQIIASSDLFLKASPNLVTKIELAIEGVGTSSATVYDDMLAAFSQNSLLSPSTSGLINVVTKFPKTLVDVASSIHAAVALSTIRIFCSGVELSRNSALDDDKEIAFSKKISLSELHSTIRNDLTAANAGKTNVDVTIKLGDQMFSFIQRVSNLTFSSTQVPSVVVKVNAIDKNADTGNTTMSIVSRSSDGTTTSVTSNVQAATARASTQMVDWSGKTGSLAATEKTIKLIFDYPLRHGQDLGGSLKLERFSDSSLSKLEAMIVYDSDNSSFALSADQKTILITRSGSFVAGKVYRISYLSGNWLDIDGKSIAVHDPVVFSTY